MRVPLDAFNLRDNLTIATPCAADWKAMSGDDRVRFCPFCRQHVYNISAMTANEAAALIREKEGNFCARLYRRLDGKVMTADCPIGIRQIVRRPWRILSVFGGAALALLGVIWSWWTVTDSERQRDFESHVTMGKLAIPPAENQQQPPQVPGRKPVANPPVGH
jgi:hypothetical protein